MRIENIQPNQILFNDHTVRKNKWIELASTAYKTQQLRKSLEKKEKELLEELKQLSKYESSRGGSFVFTKGERKGSIDYNKIPILQQMDLEPYRKDAIQMWKLQRI